MIIIQIGINWHFVQNFNVQRTFVLTRVPVFWLMFFHWNLLIHTNVSCNRIKIMHIKIKVIDSSIFFVITYWAGVGSLVSAAYDSKWNLIVREKKTAKSNLTTKKDKQNQSFLSSLHDKKKRNKMNGSTHHRNGIA